MVVSCEPRKNLVEDFDREVSSRPRPRDLRGRTKHQQGPCGARQLGPRVLFAPIQYFFIPAPVIHSFCNVTINIWNINKLFLVQLMSQSLFSQVLLRYILYMSLLQINGWIGNALIMPLLEQPHLTYACKLDKPRLIGDVCKYFLPS